MVDRRSALERAVVLERGACWVAVRVPGRHVEVVEDLRLLDEVGSRAVLGREVLKEARDDVTPGFLAEVEVKGLHGLLGGLLGGEASPLVAAEALGIDRMVEIAFRLAQPVGRSLRHGSPVPSVALAWVSALPSIALAARPAPLGGGRRRDRWRAAAGPDRSPLPARPARAEGRAGPGDKWPIRGLWQAVAMSRSTTNRRTDRRRRRLEERKRYQTVQIGPNLLLASPEAVGRAIAALPEDLDWSILAEDVVPLFGRRRPLPVDAPAPIQVVLPPGLSVGFGVDIGPAFITITESLLARWGIDRAELVHRALANVESRARLLDPSEVHHAEVFDDLWIAILTARILPASALLLLPHELERLFGPEERLFIAPMRDLLIGFPADVDPLTAASIRDILAEHDPNALALEGVRLRDGRLTCEVLDGAVGYG